MAKQKFVGQYHKRTYKTKPGIKDGRSSRAQARRLAKGAYECIAKINKEIINKAKKMKIYPDGMDPDEPVETATPGEMLNKAVVVGSSVGAEVGKGLSHARSNKVLQAVYTLLESNIEAIMAKGLMTALTDQSAVGSQMVRYFLDMYVPDETIKRKWEAEDGKGSLTQIQQMLFLKMTMDTSGLSIKELQGLVSERTVSLKNVTDLIPIDAEPEPPPPDKEPE